ncbi:epoxide hydrolase family protein [Actinotalea caeni]|uniref:epoxide hydrolase family protein n=1 Tax=Actinotalea caeni TaxID=1348467 RepID=UPI0012E123A8|nr:epoxide hydrolase family protein [Actinotalea caeni]
MHTSIRPFTLAVTQADLDDLHARLSRTRWAPALPGVGWERGTPVRYLQDLAAYWRDEFDWRAQERRLNELPQFTTTIDGQELHFFHVRSPEPDALPLLVSHGWPSTPVEFQRIVGPLTDPRAHGGDPADAFHLVMPTLPGFGLSPPVTTTGWGLPTTVAAYAELMRRLGYTRYGTQGGDIGAGVAGMLAGVSPDTVIGVHMNGPTGYGALPEGLELSERDRERARLSAEFEATGSGYLALQSNQPSTIGVALHDSPVAQLAWMVEKYQAWTDPGKALPEDAVDRDQLLTTVTATWFSGGGAGSAHFVYESMHSDIPWTAPGDDDASSGWQDAPSVPVGVAVFAADTSIRALVDSGNVVRWTEYDAGGHFPAMEVPELLVDDVRAFFAMLR